MVPAPAAPQVFAEREAAVLARLASLRTVVHQRQDPLQWRFLEVLAQRWQAEADGALRAVLLDKLERALDKHMARLASWRQAAAAEIERVSDQKPSAVREWNRLLAAGDYKAVLQSTQASQRRATESPLAALNQYLHNATRAGGVPAPARTGDNAPEMKSLQRFRETWSRLSAEDELVQAIGRAPENAGPLNTHMLMLRSLTLMHGCSPHYLGRYLSHAHTLLWLEQAGQRALPADAKAGRRSRQKK